MYRVWNSAKILRLGNNFTESPGFCWRKLKKSKTLNLVLQKCILSFVEMNFWTIKLVLFRLQRFLSYQVFKFNNKQITRTSLRINEWYIDFKSLKIKIWDSRLGDGRQTTSICFTPEFCILPFLNLYRFIFLDETFLKLNTILI